MGRMGRGLGSGYDAKEASNAIRMSYIHAAVKAREDRGCGVDHGSQWG
jgi:hypothetical protein